jgi:hypothetical protein
VAGLAKDEKTTLRLIPSVSGDRSPAETVEIPLRGDGSSVHLVIPPHALVPCVYEIRLDERPQKQKLIVGHGVPNSTTRISQVDKPLSEAGGNMAVGNLFNAGLVLPDGTPRRSFHGPGDVNQSAALEGMSKLLAENTASLIYMYWTGFVLHKPWGIHKSWANEGMGENMRLFNFSAAQSLRRYSTNILAVGPIDEPGLAWGKTPAGGSASGFPNWDEQPWYEARGWNFTQDITSRGESDFLKYLRIRTKILRENYQLAKDDFRRVWPDVVWGGDLYAAQAITDGTDPMNQVVNDVVTTHIFTDWGVGKFSTIGGSYLEKSHNPRLPVAHAMNGQLFGWKSSENSMYAYFMLLNTMLAAGMESNWWLNSNDISAKDLRRVNEAAIKMGPLFREMQPAPHPIAVLWSYTNLGLQQFEIAKKESAKKTGEQILLMVSDAPELKEWMGEEGTPLHAYSVGGNYKSQVLWTHSALNRAGYPAHILHEDLLPDGALQNYQILAVPGLVHSLPDSVMQALKEFTDQGGILLADRSTTIELPGMLRVDADFTDAGYKWSLPFELQEKVEKKLTTQHNLRDASYFRTNAFMESFNREAAPAFRAAMQQTSISPTLLTDSVDLGVEHHTGGEGSLIMVINGKDTPPQDGPSDKSMPIYNFAGMEASYQIRGIPADSVVYKIEGLDWDRVSLVKDPSSVQTEHFDPSEMKLYLVAPRAPKQLTLNSTIKDGVIQVSVTLDGLKMPWPIQIVVEGPDSKPLYKVWRATNAGGSFREGFPIGLNAPAGNYQVIVSSPVADLKVAQKFSYSPQAVPSKRLPEPVRVFDRKTIQDFLGSKPKLTIAVGKNPSHQEAAKKLAAALNVRGIPASIKSEENVMRKALYPRVWDPYTKVHQPSPTTVKAPASNVMRDLRIESEFYETPTITTPDGKPVTEAWRTPGTRLTVTGRGFIDTFTGAEQFVEPGVQIFVEGNGALTYLNSEVIETKTTPEFRSKWVRPWKRITGYIGGYNLTPQLPQAWTAEDHLILLGTSQDSELVAALQAAEILPQYADTHHPGPGKALVSFAWSPFALEKNVILIGSSDGAGLDAGIGGLLDLLP